MKERKIDWQTDSLKTHISSPVLHVRTDGRADGQTERQTDGLKTHIKAYQYYTFYAATCHNHHTETHAAADELLSNTQYTENP